MAMADGVREMSVLRGLEMGTKRRRRTWMWVSSSEAKRMAKCASSTALERIACMLRSRRSRQVCSSSVRTPRARAC
jgi:hypothetical protein